MNLKYFSEIYKLNDVSEFLKLAKQAIKNQDKIIIYADADMDGSASAIILEDVLRYLGANVIKVYFPDREKDGYGINEKSLLQLSRYSPAILISLDCGITNFKEVELAKKMGFRVWFVEHHEIIGKKPRAEIVIDSKDPINSELFFNLSNTGLVFYLTRALLKEFEVEKKDLESFFNDHIILTMIATIADMMKVDDINKDLIDRGIELFPDTKISGLRVFSQRKLIKTNSQREEIQKIVSILNVTKSKYHFTGAYILLMAHNMEKAFKIARELIKDQEKRRDALSNFAKKIIYEIENKKTESKIVFVSSNKYPISFSGSLASRICNHFKKPTFIVSINNTSAKAGVRVPHKYDSIEALKSVAKFLENFGGHKAASGFSSKTENLKKVEKGLEKYFNNLK